MAVSEKSYNVNKEVGSYFQKLLNNDEEKKNISKFVMIFNIRQVNFWITLVV